MAAGSVLPVRVPPAARGLARSALIGAVSGMRSQLGVAAAALAMPAGTRGQPAALLSGRTAKAVAAVAAVGELVVDKLPSTPSRLKGAGLVPRALLGAFAAAALTSRAGQGRAWRAAADDIEVAEDAATWPGDDRTASDAAFSLGAEPGLGLETGLDDEPVLDDATEPWSRTTVREPDRPPLPDAAFLVPAALTGAAAAVATAYAGAAWRRVAAHAAGPDWPGAALEDAAAIALAWIATTVLSEPQSPQPLD